MTFLCINFQTKYMDTSKITYIIFLGLRPEPSDGCLWKVLSCREKIKNDQWDILDCKNDERTMTCCDYECRKEFGHSLTYKLFFYYFPFLILLIYISYTVYNIIKLHFSRFVLKYVLYNHFVKYNSSNL